MAPGPGGPGADAVVGADEVVAGVDGVVAVSPAADQLAADEGALVAALVVGAEGVGEGAGRRR